MSCFCRYQYSVPRGCGFENDYSTQFIQALFASRWYKDGEEFWYAGTRRVALYYFDLIRDDEKMTMPVIGNPYVDQLIAQGKHELVSVGNYRRAQHEIEMEARV